MTSLGEDFARAVAAKDHDRVRQLLHPELDFRAMTPKRIWEAETPEDVVSALRTTNAEVGDEMPLLSYLEKMDHSPFRYPTPDGYPLEASHWYSTLLWRWKFALALANNEINGTKIDRASLDKVLGSDTALIASMLNRQPNAAESDGFTRSGDGLALILASPAFQHC